MPMDDLISRKTAIKACIEVSKQEEEHSKMWATGLRYAKRILTEAPSVPAVPLDKLCEWLANNALPAPCYYVEDYCHYEDFGHCDKDELPSVKDCWRIVLSKWMKELDEISE